MPWMIRWPAASRSSRRGHGARFRDVDGHEYVDFCLGDTAAMTGHSPEATVRALAEQARRGITLMLPSEDSIWVGEELGRRFGLPRWQFALTATDANRSRFRLARELTGRPEDPRLQLVLPRQRRRDLRDAGGRRRLLARGQRRASRPAGETTRVVEWNDPEALERELAHGDVACVLPSRR
jgi:glutamate-1-semialdehyde aminotransferase